jgi:hypothetical protein
MTAVQPERRLSAVLVADVVGYSRLIERDEGARSRASTRTASSWSSRYSPNIEAAS